VAVEVLNRLATADLIPGRGDIRLLEPEKSALLKIFLPFVVAFLASRMFYGWVNKAGLQSPGFSPTVASILSTPILTFAFYILATRDFIHGSIRNELSRVPYELIWFAPIFLILSPLLAIYLRGGFRRKKTLGIILSGATVACLILEFLWLYVALGHDS
jgi:hypothetical protein